MSLVEQSVDCLASPAEHQLDFSLERRPDSPKGREGYASDAAELDAANRAPGGVRASREIDLAEPGTTAHDPECPPKPERIHNAIMPGDA